MNYSKLKLIVQIGNDDLPGRTTFPTDARRPTLVSWSVLRVPLLLGAGKVNG